MFKAVSKLVGALLVLVGVAAPIGACYMLLTSKPQVDFYWDHVFGSNSYGKLTDDQREHALIALDAMIERAPKLGDSTAQQGVLLPDNKSDSPARN